MATTRRRRGRRLYVRPDNVRSIAHNKLGLHTDKEIATLINVNPSNLSMYMHGHVQPNPTVIAMLVGLLDVPFEALFEVRVISTEPSAQQVA